MRGKINEITNDITNMSSDVSRQQSTDIQNFKSKIIDSDLDLAKHYFQEYAKQIGLIEQSGPRSQNFLNMKKETQFEMVDSIGFFSTWLMKFFTQMPTELLANMCRSMVTEWIRHEDQKLMFEHFQR